MLNPISPQELFDKALFGIRGQGYARSMNGGSCAYRGEDGLKCGIGHALPDELCVLADGTALDNLSDPGINAILASLETFGRPQAPLTEFLSACTQDLISGIQNAHDEELRATPVSECIRAWEGRMSGLAGRHGLKYTEPAQDPCQQVTA